ncbi:13920_t:CDS:1, partial [Acaulospora colombiana]
MRTPIKFALFAIPKRLPPAVPATCVPVKSSYPSEPSYPRENGGKGSRTVTIDLFPKE